MNKLLWLIAILLIFCGPTENALRGPWHAIQPLDCPLFLPAMAWDRSPSSMNLLMAVLERESNAILRLLR